MQWYPSVGVFVLNVLSRNSIWKKIYDLWKKNITTPMYIYVQYTHSVKTDEQKVEFMNYFETVVITRN